MKLNGWQRIGVVVSLLWAIGAGIYERKSTIEHANHIFYLSGDWCRSEAKAAKDFEELVNRDILAAMAAEDKAYKECGQRALKTLDKMRAVDGNAVLSILAGSFLPIIFGWLFAVFSIKIFRWVRVGFPTGSAVPVGARSTFVAAPPPQESAVTGDRESAVPAAREHETQHADGRQHTPFWLALIAFAVAVLFVANRLIAQNAGVSPLASLSALPTSLPTLARHPDAVMSYLAEATGTAVVIPLLHLGVAAIFPSMRNKTSRRRIFIGWSVVGAIAATLL
jgi:hypothetical protein